MENDLISRQKLIDDLEAWRKILDRRVSRFDDMVIHTLPVVFDLVNEQEAVKAEPVRWVNIPGYEGLYEINTLAQIRNAEGKILKQGIRREKYTCYKVVHLWKDGKYTTKGVHRIMAEAFVPNPNNFPVVNHKDEDGTNNLLSNIEWCDKSYNASYGSSPSKISKAFKGRASEKRIPVQQLKNGLIVGEYPCAGDAEKATGISMANIRLVCRGKRKLAGGYAWRYCGAKMDGGAE